MTGGFAGGRPDIVSVALDNLTEGVVFVDGAGEILHMNPEALRIHGFSSLEQMRRNAAQYSLRIETLEGHLVEFEDWPINRMLRGERFKELEVRLFGTGPGPRREWIGSYGGSPIVEDGKVVAGVLTVRDITAGKNHELQIRQLADSMTQLAWMANRDGSIYWYNKRWYEYTGSTLSEMAGWGWSKVHHPDHVERVVAFVAEAWRKPEPWELTFPLRGADGRWRWFLTRAVPITDSDGGILQWFGTNTDIDEQKGLLEKFKRSEERLNVAASSAGIGIWEWDLPSGELTVTPIERRLIGLPEDTAVNVEQVLDSIHPHDRERVRHLLQAAVEKREDYVAEFRVERPGGGFTWIFSKGKAVYDDAGRAVRMLGVDTDITDRREWASRIGEIEERLRLATESGNIGIWDLNTRSGRLVLNDTFLEDWGIAPATFGGTLAEGLDRIHPDDRDRVVAELDDAIHRGRRYDVEYRVVRPGGEVIWINAKGKSFPGADGASDRLSGVSVNVTARKCAEEGLRRTTEILNAIMTSSSDLIYVKDRLSKMVYCNPMTLKLIGTTEAELYGKDDVEFLGPGHGGQAILANDERIMVSGVGETTEDRVTWADGTARIYMSKKEPHRDSRGRITGIIGISRDITELKETQARIEASVATRDDFLSIASHELKTPLTSLKLQAQILKRAIVKGDASAFAPERVVEMVDQTDKQVSRLNRLVDDMLDVSRIRTGKLAIERERLDFCELVAETIARLKDHFAAGSYEVPEVARCAGTQGDWDRMRLEQVVTNLLTNAIRYGSRKPISVEVGSDESSVRLVVRDRGIGIAPDLRERIFDRFERAINANEVSGLGLGLFITKQIVIAHDGRIRVESEVGHGSTFIVELPRAGSGG